MAQYLGAYVGHPPSPHHLHLPLSQAAWRHCRLSTKALPESICYPFTDDVTRIHPGLYTRNLQKKHTLNVQRTLIRMQMQVTEEREGVSQQQPRQSASNHQCQSHDPKGDASHNARSGPDRRWDGIGRGSGLRRRCCCCCCRRCRNNARGFPRRRAIPRRRARCLKIRGSDWTVMNSSAASRGRTRGGCAEGGGGTRSGEGVVSHYGSFEGRESRRHVYIPVRL